MLLCDCYVFFFFKQKTAYEMRISDWSSDVCSSDLVGRELAIQHIAGDDRPFAMILGKPASPRPCSQPLRPHQSFDPVQAAGYPVGQQIVPDTARTIGAIASYMAGTDLRKIGRAHV